MKIWHLPLLPFLLHHLTILELSQDLPMLQTPLQAWHSSRMFFELLAFYVVILIIYRVVNLVIKNINRNLLIFKIIKEQMFLIIIICINPYLERHCEGFSPEAIYTKSINEIASFLAMTL